MQNYNNNYSPIIKEPFIWVAEYNDGTSISEIDFKDVSGFGLRKHTFNEIDKSKLKYFGIIGYGHKFYYNIIDGIFNVYNTNIKVLYHDNDNNIDYILNDNKYYPYNDIISYRTMYEELKMNTGAIDKGVYEYGLGYKSKLDGIHLETILHLTMNDDKPAFLTFKLTSDIYINGELRIYANDALATVIKTELNEKRSKQFKIDINL